MQTRKRALRGNPGVDGVVRQTYRATPEELLDDFQLLCNQRLSSLSDLQHCVEGGGRRRKQRTFEGGRQLQEDLRDRQDIEAVLGLASLMSQARQSRLKQKSVKKEAPLVPVSKAEDEPVAPPQPTGPMGYPKMLPPFMYFSGFPSAMHPPLSSSVHPQPSLGQPQRVQYPPQWAKLYSQMLQAHIGNLPPQMTQLLPQMTQVHPQQDPSSSQMTQGHNHQDPSSSQMTQVHPQQDPLNSPMTHPPMTDLQPQPTQIKPQPQRPKVKPSEASQKAGLKRGTTHIAIAYFISSHQSKAPQVSTNLKRLKSSEPLLS
jgi:hypothetical protein